MSPLGTLPVALTAPTVDTPELAHARSGLVRSPTAAGDGAASETEPGRDLHRARRAVGGARTTQQIAFQV